MSVNNNQTGLEWLFTTVKNDLRHKTDALVLYIHYKLISSGFKCIGNGDATTAADTNTPTELLPTDWNSNCEVYTLRYVFNTQGHVLKVVPVEDKILINFLRYEGEATTSISVVLNEYIRDSYQTFITAYNDLSPLSETVEKELLAPLLPKQPDPPKQQEQQQQEQQEQPTNLPRVPNPTAPRWDPLMEPPRLGGNDLNPLGGGIGVGGGMLMDPRGNRGMFMPPGNLPRGAVPPGARFDPFQPINPRGGFGGRGRNFGPDPDNLPPPGADDMFM